MNPPECRIARRVLVRIMRSPCEAVNDVYSFSKSLSLDPNFPCLRIDLNI